jgi:glycosyltransferase involved in cell wall biosynthesis
MKILLITYHFHPEKNAGIDRPYSIYKYAPECGMELNVVTTSIGPAEPVLKNVTRFPAALGWRRPSKMLSKGPLKIFSKLFQPLYFDIDFRWCYKIITYFKKRGMREYDAIYAIYPEASALVCAKNLSSTHNLPLFTDFTDSIMCDPLVPLNFIQRKTHPAFESSIMRQSRAVFTIAEGMKVYLESEYKDKNVYNIYNGFDPDDFSVLAASSILEKNPLPVRVMHFGSINASRKRDVSPLFKAISKLKTDEQIGQETIQITFIGNFTRGERRLVRELDITDLVDFRGFMNKKAGFDLIANSYDYLLLYGTPGEPSTVTSKLPEYLKLHKPILGICKNNEAASIISRAGAGAVCDFVEDEIFGLLKQAVRREVPFSPDVEYIETFSRKTQTAFIIDHIKSNLNTIQK